MIQRLSSTLSCLSWFFAFCALTFAQQQTGYIRGVVYDKDFDAPLAGVQVRIAEADDLNTLCSDQGIYHLSQIPVGVYTVVFSKDGYSQQVKSDVVVSGGQLTDIDVYLSGEFIEMEEFVVQDELKLSAGSEGSLLQLRTESPALVDSISAELMSQAGASDAASALRLVAGASVRDGKSAVIRGLPDRYVSSQMNGVRLPSADEDKRAVELDQFPTAVIQDIVVSKTFTPDQQGDASGGAVDVRLKGIPDETVFELKSELSSNSSTTGRRDFLTYDGGGVGSWGRDRGERDIQFENLGGNWKGATGTSLGLAPIDHKWSMAGGTSYEFDNGIKFGGFANFFYERDSSLHDGVDDSYWVESPDDPMTPESNQGTPADGDFKTSLFDITQGAQSLKVGGLGTVGLEYEGHALGVTFLRTRTSEDKATLAIDTRGKEYYFPGYDPDNPEGPGNDRFERDSAPYLRLETLEYTERETKTLQFNGKHPIPLGGFEIGKIATFGEPEFDWVYASSSADFNQPDKRQFGALWLPADDTGLRPPSWFPYKPAATFTLGNLQRIYKSIEEDSKQFSLNLKLPFAQWSDAPGFIKTGYFDDRVDRVFDQDSFSNFNETGISYGGDFDEPWSDEFPFEDHPITESLSDVDYDGDLDVSAWYTMMDLPLTPSFNLIGGVRWETTHIAIVNIPEEDATWFPPGSTAAVELLPGESDVDFDREDALPSLGFVYEPLDQFTLRGSYSETVARQTFKELTPILQQEFLGGPIFIGNPELEMSTLTNYDVRIDHRPVLGTFISASFFYKEIDNAIEYVQKLASGFTYTTPVNYPKGLLKGYEFEARQNMSEVWDTLSGLSLGANATFIDSSVRLPDEDKAEFAADNIQAPLSSREMTNAPEHLYNIYLTYDLEPTHTQFSLFYTVQGDTLLEGAGAASGNFVPSIYAKEFQTLNFSIVQKLGEYFALQFQAKNLTNAEIETVYRSSSIKGDVTNTSFRKGVDYSISLNARVAF